MLTDTLLKLLPLAFSLVSVIISILSYLKNEKTRKLSVLNFSKILKEPYSKWRDQLGTIELDPSPGAGNRKYTDEERRKIRDYWPRVALEELRMLKKVDRKLVEQDWIDWKMYLKEGISHQSILQEFAYYANYEDAGNRDKEELFEIIKGIYKEAYGKEMDVVSLVEERSSDLYINATRDNTGSGDN